MKRARVDLDAIAAVGNLAGAFWRAARGRRHRPEVVAFAADLPRSLSALAAAIHDGAVPRGRWSRFEVHDPKRRLILAPAFEDRVLHHALIAQLGPVLERGLVADTFACRPRRGTLAAVRRAQHHARRHPAFLKTDVRAYFASIDHTRLLELLARRFRGAAVLDLCARVIRTVPGATGRGLPIGALTSQHFANLYLDGFDRLMLEGVRVAGYVRYMDDAVSWFTDPAEARGAFERAAGWLAAERGLELHPPLIGRSAAGVPFLGFLVRPGRLRLLRRRRRRYAAARARWERRWARGDIDGPGLQAGVDAALAITAHADAVAWRREQLRRVPPVDA